MNDLNDENFSIYAIKAYDRPNCIMSEFESDIKKIKYLKRLFRKYKATGVLKERLIVNHLIILFNMFGPEATTRMLFLKVEKEHHAMLKTFLLFLNFMPDTVKAIAGEDIISSDISVDLTVAANLRKL